MLGNTTLAKDGAILKKLWAAMGGDELKLTKGSGDVLRWDGVTVGVAALRNYVSRRFAYLVKGVEGVTYPQSLTCSFCNV
ncbi:hypothetical protein TrLO_g1632 [Triparma laevis f. longispina]|uniref:Uncharacterized protein n=1 Tax=Triparma laevis f. longispina TaxID=1714387 RepID=A0A9W7AL38_9STRA|nr:hypothetical protein TrLO_g1632 [Triparma laevis f. longispina]